MDSPLIGVELSAEGSVSLPLDPTFEHAICVLEGAVTTEGTTVQTNQLVYFAPGWGTVHVETDWRASSYWAVRPSTTKS